MATAADRLANNLNFGALGKATELRQRLLFTLGALIIFRLGTFLPIPGVKYQALTQPLTLRCWDYSKNGDLM